MRNIKIDNVLYDIITYDEFIRAYKNNELDFNTAVEVGEYFLPVRRLSETGQFGINLIHGGDIAMTNIPDEENKIEYTKDNKNFIDFSNSKDIKDVIRNGKKIKDIEQEILVSSDNITKPKISIEDEPLMRAVKESILNKNIDINKYEKKFGANFHNDIRLLSGHSITLKKALSFFDNLDLDAKIIIQDSRDAINPMDKTVEIDLTTRGD